MAGITRISSRSSAADGVVKHGVGKHPMTAVSKTDSQNYYHLTENAQKLASELCSPPITVLAFYG